MLLLKRSFYRELMRSKSKAKEIREYLKVLDMRDEIEDCLVLEGIFFYN